MIAAIGAATHHHGNSATDVITDFKDESSSVESSRPSSGDVSSERSPSVYGISRFLMSDAEQRILSWTRFTFLFCLLVSASALAAAVYLNAHHDEEGDFSAKFESLSHDIIDLSDDHTHRIANIFHALTRVITTYIIAEHGTTNSTFGKGFVTIPGFEKQLGEARNHSGALIIAYVPDVSVSELEAWNQYSTENQGWVQESHGTTDSVIDSILPSIWANTLAEQGSSCDVVGHRKLLSEEARADRVPVDSDTGPFSPVWTFTPPPRVDDLGIINFDLRGKSIWRNAVNAISTTREAAFLGTCNFASWFDNEDLFHSEVVQTMMIYPVFDSHDHNTANIVGHLVVVVPWSIFFEGVLLSDTPSIVVVVKNTCGEVFSFEMIGRNANFLGQEDRHDKAFEDMMHVDSWAHIDAHSSYYGEETNADHADHEEETNEDIVDHDDHGEETPVENGDHGDDEDDVHDDHDDHLDEGICLYTISVYPTKAFQEEYVTMQPAAYASVVLGIFFVTSVLFFLLDCFIRRKVDQVTKVALKQNAIVSSLFPKDVQDKLMAEASQHGKLGKAGIRSFLTADQESGNAFRESAVLSKPIADLFPATTIMFADIPGFAAWSLEREPSQVFTLLESIFSEFDRIAHRRKVFKVEVVGDCYVAVCGLPDPRQDHALVMAKFAMDCLTTLDHVTERLIPELGPETSTLKLRVGLHSGPVVAGVLRGDKSRFQLFGDTMNTASRMASTGQPSSIQVSQETADLLIADGKQSWLTQRKDAVTAKGKGELVTFFVARPKDPSQTSVNDINGHASNSSGLDEDELDGA